MQRVGYAYLLLRNLMLTLIKYWIARLIISTNAVFWPTLREKGLRTRARCLASRKDRSGLHIPWCHLNNVDMNYLSMRLPFIGRNHRDKWIDCIESRPSPDERHTKGINWKESYRVVTKKARGDMYSKYFINRPI